MPKLDNDKWERFAHEYIIDANATKSAIRAGYSETSAGQYGHELLQKLEIQNRIAELAEQIAGDIDLTAERVLRELARVGFADLRDVAHWNQHGLGVENSEGLTDAAAASVRSVKSTTTHEKNGVSKLTMEITQHDKVRALELLGKRFALFTDKVQQTGDGELTIRMLGLPDKSRGDGSHADANA